MQPPPPVIPARALFARHPLLLALLLALTLWALITAVVISWSEYIHRGPYPHRLAVSPDTVAHGGELTVRGIEWGDVLDDGTGPHVDIYVLGYRCQDPYRPHCYDQQARASLADDGTFAATITLQNLIGGKTNIYVTSR